MQLTITVLKDSKSGQKEGKFGKFTWYSCGAQFEEYGDKWFNGFIKDYELKKFGVQYPKEMTGKKVEVNLSQEEYNGKMQDKFAIVVPKAEQASHFDGEALRRIEALASNTNAVVMRIYKHLGIEEKQTAGNTNIPYPEYTGEPNFDKDVPF